MIIPIADGWRITTDSHQWICQKYRGLKEDKNTGETVEAWSGEMYYPPFEAAIKGLSERLVRELDSEGVEQAIEDIKDLCSRISAALPDKIEVKHGC